MPSGKNWHPLPKYGLLPNKASKRQRKIRLCPGCDRRRSKAVRCDDRIPATTHGTATESAGCPRRLKKADTPDAAAIAAKEREIQLIKDQTLAREKELSVIRDVKEQIEALEKEQLGYGKDDPEYKALQTRIDALKQSCLKLRDRPARRK